MISKQQVEINVSAYRQIQSEIETLISKLERRIELDPVIYVSTSPDRALDDLYLAVEGLESVIESLLNNEEDENDILSE